MSEMSIEEMKIKWKETMTRLMGAQFRPWDQLFFSQTFPGRVDKIVQAEDQEFETLLRMSLATIGQDAPLSTEQVKELWICDDFELQYRDQKLEVIFCRRWAERAVI